MSSNAMTHNKPFTIVVPALETSFIGADWPADDDFAAVGLQRMEPFAIEGFFGDPPVTTTPRKMVIQLPSGEEMRFDAEVTGYRYAKPPRKTKKALAKAWEDRGPRERLRAERFRSIVSVSLQPVTSPSGSTAP
jgi:hypothetical protein